MAELPLTCRPFLSIDEELTVRFEGCALTNSISIFYSSLEIAGTFLTTQDLDFRPFFFVLQLEVNA